jgi:hypothetical protein
VTAGLEPTVRLQAGRRRTFGLQVSAPARKDGDRGADARVKDVERLLGNIEASVTMKGRNQPGPSHLRLVVSVGFLHLAFSA